MHIKLAMRAKTDTLFFSNKGYEFTETKDHFEEKKEELYSMLCELFAINDTDKVLETVQ